ncbi:hypothetical protein GCM10009087_48570 [Sphingomonas oligophenolica]|uniref:STAS/SEC14 domain-containing protein n=1 Tax=Sphingomonas oligophenolica TaxID=301154 RepID=A0ABU9YBU4_9SPHN
MAFEVRAERERNRLHISLVGMASVDDVKQFELDLQRAVDALPAYRGPHQLRYDVSGAAIQSQDVVQALRLLALASPRTSAFALVNGSALAGRQLRRIFSGIDVHTSADRDAAISWLDSQARG